ncbi:DUF3137 domain-containing protein [Maliponia aquimaris]|uniref:DUF3137 domain-containing protein n=1 Tax=Maliponia aquimaris TaxID=1673631 RepID=A0A238JS29_9RHOB|nr:DUF3137 domain-containing protein [Maliponia aquimaris]SMX33478.1 hypothetical protein MAA8898_00473 [Maliponia aquimaris]
MQFTEQSPIETGFAEIFAREIAPRLDELEAQRQALSRKGWLWFAVVVAVFVGIAAVAWPALGGFGAVFFLIFGAIAGLIARGLQGNKWTGAVAETVMPHVCAFLGETRYDRSAATRFPLDRVESIGLIGSHDSARLEDQVVGRWQGVDYTLVEARLTRSSNSKDKKTSDTVFSGLLFRIGLPHPAPTRIVILRNYGRTLNAVAGFLSRGKGRGLPRVDTGHAGFEKDFELHAADPDAALDYLPAAFLDNLVAIGETESDKGTKGMRAAFDGEDFWLALDRTKPFMEMASLGKPVSNITEDLHRVFDDMALIRRIIEWLRA